MHERHKGVRVISSGAGPSQIFLFFIFVAAIFVGIGWLLIMLVRSIS